MTPFDPVHGAQAAYNFWLGLIPQFLGQFGGGIPVAAPGATDEAARGSTGTAARPFAGFPFPADQIAKAAAATQESLQAMARSMASLIQAEGAPGLLGHWATAMPPFAFGNPDAAAATTDAAAMQALMAPWSALMANAAVATPIATALGSMPSASEGAAASMLPWQAMSQSWADMASRMTGATPAQLGVVFDRTYGALSDALGLSPVRKLQAAWQDLVAAAFAQQEARTKYALLVQSAFAEGLQRLMRDLADRANSGDRIDSVLALLRLWAVKTEEVVPETLQSETGLAATTAVTRSALTYRRKIQQVASIVGEALDMATRRELDEAYREIQALKRELRALRPKSRPGREKPGASPR
jgi:hypothetical protein